MTGPSYDQYTITVTVVVPAGTTAAQVCTALVGRELPGTEGSQVIAAGTTQAPAYRQTRPHTGDGTEPDAFDDGLDDIDDEPEPDEPYD